MVVLVIGILAAVALPQYQVAVDKSRLMQAYTWNKAIKQAAESYFMEHGKYPNRLEQLDVAVPSCSFWQEAETTDYNWYKCGAYKIKIGTNGDLSKMGTVLTYWDGAVIEFYFHSNTKLCTVYSKSERWTKVCKALGGVDKGNTNKYFYLP